MIRVWSSFSLSISLITYSYLSPFSLQMMLLHLGQNLPTLLLLSFRIAFLNFFAPLSHNITWKSLFSGLLVWTFFSIVLLTPYFPVYECLYKDTWISPPHFHRFSASKPKIVVFWRAEWKIMYKNVLDAPLQL